jgi:3-hydroxyacyl-CoA dehydrogenase/enoyl-CoA hydratase/3-hydroxybutyryl-CoA epimerase/enoyl-CoA isomerase
MHFFNPVPMMALVEVIRGGRSSDAAVSTAVAYAVAMGKTPIVVKDCPGFLVNRILTPYIMAFTQLVADGADFSKVDQVLERFGWPMGPAYLQDVIGMDTSTHVVKIISAGYPERMVCDWGDAVALMAEHGRFGQKNGLGFYRYESDTYGKPRKVVAEDSHSFLASLQPSGRKDFTEEEIVQRCMLPLILEAVHCLEDDVVANAAELDTALLLGIGFPAYLGGALKYADWLGIAEVVTLCDRYAPVLGPLYQATERLRVMAKQGESFY